MPQYKPTTLTDLRLRDLPRGRHEAAEIPTGTEGWYRLAESYKEAADRLVASMEDPFTYAMYGAPLMFMYRHYIELHLKSLLLDAGELLDEPQDIPPKHYLLGLWRRVRQLLLAISPESDGVWFRRSGEVISDFDSIDPTSFVFRYPVNNAGHTSTARGQYIDPQVARQMIGELHILLSGASSQIDVYMGYKYDRY